MNFHLKDVLRMAFEMMTIDEMTKWCKRERLYYLHYMTNIAETRLRNN